MPNTEPLPILVTLTRGQSEVGSDCVKADRAGMGSPPRRAGTVVGPLGVDNPGSDVVAIDA
jgi:hypothetical protein